MASRLFSPLRLREIEFKNRIFLSPMCQYSSENGMPTDWHFVHLGSRAVGGAALVMVEATAVSPEGRISPWDSGLWSDEHAQASARPVTVERTDDVTAVIGAGLQPGETVITDGQFRISPGAKVLVRKAGQEARP